MLRQLREQKGKSGLKLFANVGSGMGVLGGVAQFKSSARFQLN